MLFKFFSNIVDKIINIFRPNDEYVRKLEQENIFLKEEIEKLKFKKTNIKRTKNISQQSIDAIVNKILKNEKINSKFLPDYVEDKIYKNVITMVFALVEEILDNSKICIMGHDITMNIEPAIASININSLVDDEFE